MQTFGNGLADISGMDSTPVPAVTQDHTSTPSLMVSTVMSFCAVIVTSLRMKNTHAHLSLVQQNSSTSKTILSKERIHF